MHSFKVWVWVADFGRLVWAAGLGGWSSSRRETALRCGGLLLAVGDSLSRGPRVTRHARHARHHAESHVTRHASRLGASPAALTTVLPRRTDQSAYRGPAQTGHRQARHRRCAGARPPVLPSRRAHRYLLIPPPACSRPLVSRPLACPPARPSARFPHPASSHPLTSLFQPDVWPGCWLGGQIPSHVRPRFHLRGRLLLCEGGGGDPTRHSLSFGCVEEKQAALLTAPLTAILTGGLPHCWRALLRQVTEDEAWNYYSVGPPYMLHREDFKKVGGYRKAVTGEKLACILSRCRIVVRTACRSVQ
jgi:hypothetical protein